MDFWMDLHMFWRIMYFCLMRPSQLSTSHSIPLSLQLQPSSVQLLPQLALLLLRRHLLHLVSALRHQPVSCLCPLLLHPFLPLLTHARQSWLLWNRSYWIWSRESKLLQRDHPKIQNVSYRIWLTAFDFHCSGTEKRPWNSTLRFKGPCIG